ncbi:hypothetical protein E1B28_010810 [Marasmius oreades]|uniref:Uncharacterized protein n=1 Tax=Marasmius oreades TaxID=181124 RepID=A0A9P7UQJ9_9AGAR|nr:uncharacterized protein E1B28_010810 [Marasmius oreades]KAG7089101.1 hypothetical protein E1B28_010810 [Marasmius oreades]
MNDSEAGCRLDHFTVGGAFARWLDWRALLEGSHLGSSQLPLLQSLSRNARIKLETCRANLEMFTEN